MSSSDTTIQPRDITMTLSETPNIVRYRAEFVPSRITTQSSERQGRHQFLLFSLSEGLSALRYAPSLPSPLDSQGAFPRAAAVYALPATQSFGVPFMLGATAAAAVPSLKRKRNDELYTDVLPGSRIHSPKIARVLGNPTCACVCYEVGSFARVAWRIAGWS